MDKLGWWQALARAAARSGDADQMLGEGLGVLAELIGADALVVLRWHGELWETAHHVGDPLDTEELAGALAAGILARIRRRPHVAPATFAILDRDFRGPAVHARFQAVYDAAAGVPVEKH